MIAREWRIAIFLTVLAMVLVMTAGYSAWYEVGLDQATIFGVRHYETHFYLTFATSPSGYYTPYYTDAAINEVFEGVMAMIILWLVAGLAFVWSCLRESRALGTFFGLVLTVVPAALTIYFVLAVPDAVQSHCGASVVIDDFAGRSTSDSGDVYV